MWFHNEMVSVSIMSTCNCNFMAVRSKSLLTENGQVDRKPDRQTSSPKKSSSLRIIAERIQIRYLIRYHSFQTNCQRKKNKIITVFFALEQHELFQIFIKFIFGVARTKKFTQKRSERSCSKIFLHTLPNAFRGELQAQRGWYHWQPWYPSS